MKQSTRSLTRGQTLVEFALMIPIFIGLLMLIFDFGRGVYYYTTIHNAAREAARYASVHPANDNGITNAAHQHAIGIGSLSNVSIDKSIIDCIGTLPNPGQSPCSVGIPNTIVKVTVSYDFNPVTPYVSQIICNCPSTVITIKGIANMRTEAKLTTP